MWRLCGVIIKIHFSDPQLNFGSVLEIHFLFIFELPYSHIENIISAEYMFLYIGRYKTLHISRQYTVFRQILTRQRLTPKIDAFSQNSRNFQNSKIFW